MPVLFTFALYTSFPFVNNRALVGRMYYYDNFHSKGVFTVENYGTVRYQFELLTHSFFFGPVSSCFTPAPKVSFPETY